jgi:hypothetical protein
MDTIRNIVSRRPALVRTLVEQNAAAAFASLTTAPPARGKGPAEILEDYKWQAIKRSEELLRYIKKWTESTPGSLPKLEPVSIPRAAFL